MAASNFTACLALTLAYEGGRVDDPRDPGGRTNEGVTQRTYDAWRKTRGLAKRDVYDMGADERDAIYRARFWNAIGADALPAGVDLATFDPAVNSGPARAKAWLAAAQASAGADSAAVISAISTRRLSFLHALRTWSRFGKGWGARVASVEAKALRMALGTSPTASATILGKAETHRAAAKAAKAKAAGVATGSAATATPTAASGHTTLLVILLLAGVIGAGIAALAAWRSTQRGEALAAEAKH